MRRYRSSIVVSALVGALVLGGVAISLWQTPQGVAQEQQPLLEYPKYLPTPTIGANPTAAPKLAGAPLATANFEAAQALEGWNFVELEPVLAESRANWVLRDGRLFQDATGRAKSPSIQETVVLTGTSAWKDYTVQVSFYDESNGTAGLIARYQGDDGPTASYYRYRILKNGYEATPKQVLEKVERGVTTTLASVETSGFTERTWNVLAMTVRGGAITVRLNGQVVAEALDPTPLPAGQAGMYTRAIGGIFFDDFSVVEE